MDARGKNLSRVKRSNKKFDIHDFVTKGSPVKHLLCWRRTKGLAIGGMDEALSGHGCDDYDFPWRMAEAGYRFKAVKECLYYYRVHHDFHRLTTHVPVEDQVRILKAMFRKHKVSEPEITAYIQNALTGYLVKDQTLSFEERFKKTKFRYPPFHAALFRMG
jgi:GT2 family glycosyltransferase